MISEIMRVTEVRRIVLVMPVLLGALFVATIGESLHAQPSASPGRLRAPDVLPPGLLRADTYAVAEAVRNDGLINTYQVTTKYGIFTIESTALLMKRLQELRAIERMEQLRKSDVYLSALKRSAVAPLETAKGLITDPIETTEGVVTGVGRWFRDVGSALTSDDPHKDNIAESVLGHSRAKRQFAFEFGVDPYSPFAPLQKVLDDVAWASAGGSLTVSAALSAIPGAAGTVVATTKTAGDMKNLVRDMSPSELSRVNEQKLEGMGVPKHIAQHFLSNPVYDPEEQTILVGELESMGGASDRHLFIKKAASAVDEPTAVFNRTQAQMFAAYHAKVGRVARCIEAAGVVLLEKDDGTVVGLFPLDHVVWTAGVSQKAHAVSTSLKSRSSVQAKEFWLTGTVDTSAQEGLTAAGWKVTPRAVERLFER